MDIVEFLTARLNEGEAVALAVSSPPWALRSADSDYGSDYIPGLGIYVGRTQALGHIDPEDAAHILQHSPERVLADIAAKRQLIARYERACQQADAERVADRWEEWRGVPPSATGAARRGEWETIASTLEGVLCQLASVYSDHPDCRAEWA